MFMWSFFFFFFGRGEERGESRNIWRNTENKSHWKGTRGSQNLYSGKLLIYPLQPFHQARRKMAASSDVQTPAHGCERSEESGKHVKAKETK